MEANSPKRMENHRKKSKQKVYVLTTGISWETSFATTDDAAVFTVIDANNDGLTWGWNDSYDGSMRSEYSANNGNDDWLRCV